MDMSENFAITIARQYGSGGREVGEKTAALLGYKYVDKELITLAAQKSGYHADVLKGIDEKATNSLLYTLAMGSSFFGGSHAGYNVDIPINDKLFILQSDIIKSRLDESPCVFVGRCADYVLSEHDNRVSIFLYADTDSRISRVCERHNVGRDEAAKLIIKTDKRRMNYYNFYTGRKWGKFDNYHLSINTSKLGIDGTAEMIADFVKKAADLAK
ncbi:MAG: cytidylate kinase-like family protein [Ruminococcaceae bacterium]|nr:cytidylate kinase-like family protein [Oscillospiraceae bacterium]